MDSASGHYRSLVDKQFGKPSSSASSSMLAVESSGQLNVLDSELLGSSTTNGSISSGNDVSNAVINFKNVTFAYPTRPSKRVFDDFSLTIKRGETLALVGKSVFESYPH